MRLGLRHSAGGRDRRRQGAVQQGGAEAGRFDDKQRPGMAAHDPADQSDHFRHRAEVHAGALQPGRRAGRQQRGKGLQAPCGQQLRRYPGKIARAEQAAGGLAGKNRGGRIAGDNHKRSSGPALRGKGGIGGQSFDVARVGGGREAVRRGGGFVKGRGTHGHKAFHRGGKPRSAPCPI